MKQMTNTFGTILCSSLVGLFCLNAQTLSAENKSKGAESPLVIGIIEEAHDDHIVVITRDKYKRTLTFDEKSTVTYVGFDKEKKDIKARFAVRVEVNKEIIQSILVTPPVAEDKVEPTPEMVKMKGTIRISVNGYSKTYKHEAVTIINEKDKLGPRFTFKGGPNCRIVFDSVRLWKCEE